MSSQNLQPPLDTPMLPPGTFNGRVAFLTGGGTGLGKAAATRLHHLGCTVVITGRREGPLDATTKEILQQNPQSLGKAFYVVMDVRSADDVNRAVDRTVELTGQIPSIVVNNAAGNFISPFENMRPNAFESISRTVISGTAFVTIEIGKRLIAAKQPGVFVSIGASYAGNGQPFLATSAAAKSATLSLVKSLGAEWGRYGIRHVMISPGPIYTEGAFARLDAQAMSGEINGGPNQKRAQDAVPLRRLGTQGEFANLMAYVCSDYASWMTGNNINFDGGAEAAGGEFEGLFDITPEQWKSIEKSVRATTDKDKKDRTALPVQSRSKM